MKATCVSDEFPQREVASKNLRDLARGLRKRETAAEQLLWEELRGRRTGGLKFRRQHPVAGTTYVADFCCYQVRLIVELEGEIHRQRRLQDLQRQEELEAMGYRVLRFSNEEVINDLGNVLAEIVRVAEESQ